MGITYRSGALVVTDPTKIITLIAYVDASSNYATFRKTNATAGYQVPAATTFYATGLKYLGSNHNNNTSISLMATDTDQGMDSVSFTGSTTAPLLATNGLTWATGESNSAFKLSPTSSMTPEVWNNVFENTIIGSVATGNYITMRAFQNTGFTNASFILTGVEV